MKRILLLFCLSFYVAADTTANTNDQLAKALNTAFDQYSHEIKAQMLSVIQEIMKQAVNGKQITQQEAQQSITQITQQAIKNLDEMPKHILEAVFPSK